ncbi:MAG: thrombospondin type 3 repeat-containing protein [Candidatus Poseidoniaceae archaeon]
MKPQALVVMILLSLTPIATTQISILQEEVHISQSSDNIIVQQFGTGFDETVIASTSDGLNVPRDLEFHPSSARSDELWIVNRADDSMVIVHNTGESNQYSEKRLDSHRNHFMEEVSSIAFGAYDSEFDFTFATGQESINTYNGQADPNYFMGPALWPSSLSHFAMEHQNDQYGGSHIDMLHESPLGMGVAHDSGNSYWYFDGYYGHLVYYDFKEDHDTGMDDHSDGVVRRYSDIQLSRTSGIPSHMILDDSTGILYISDTGTNRVLWVNTHDTTVTTTNILGDSTQFEPLAEYSRVTGAEWGVIDTGLSNPSGIALDGDTLFVGQNGNNKISAYDLSTNGKSGSLVETVNTTASSLMGLEIGPEGKLYYVDGSQYEVVRIDAWPDVDEDGVRDSLDNCVNDANFDQADYDSDSVGDVCDDDIDGDSITNDNDSCSIGENQWTSSMETDYDSDGCADNTEDQDDDSDSVIDLFDTCRFSPIGWTSESASDYDSDGCRDFDEDLDDDSDGICDIGGPETDCVSSSVGQDFCPFSPLGFVSSYGNDFDGDGCNDFSEDNDDDGDGFDDSEDKCNLEFGTAYNGRQIGCLDTDGDGWADREDDFIDDSTQWLDLDEDGYGNSPTGTTPDGCITVEGTSTIDRYGCPDSDDDGYSNPDTSWQISDGADAFPLDNTQWHDMDADGFGDNSNGQNADDCVDEFGTSTIDRLGCVDSDGDGYSDLNDEMINDPTQWVDTDGDGFGDNKDGTNGDWCVDTFGTSSEIELGCLDIDNDGYSDNIDLWPEDTLRWSDEDGDGYTNQQGTDTSDDCPDVAGTSTIDLLGCLDTDGDGTSDRNDFYPNDKTRSKEESLLHSWVIWASVIAILGILLGFAFVFRNRNANSIAFNETPNVNYNPELPRDLPIPPEGLPPGWTLEQWNYYGEEWINSQNK